ncbi:hypothetical protein MT390_19260 [Vibrio sp. 2-Bac 85]
MSRWVDQFENHVFQVQWKKILEVTNDLLLDDGSVVTSVEELARLNKVVSYLNSLLIACDPELIPLSTWDNFNSQSDACLKQINSYQQNRNIGHITNANNHLDNLLTYLRPYQVVAGKAAQSASGSFVAYTKTIHSNLTTFQAKANEILTEIGEFKNSASQNAQDSELSSQKIKELEVSYFDDSENESLSTRINELEDKLKENYRKVQEYKVELFGGESSSESISSEIKQALSSAELDSETINKSLIDVKEKLSNFKSYYTAIFGNKNEEGELEGGLKSEIIARENHLDKFKEQQELRYKSLNDEIDSLLPGATSAGLATAYYDLKVSFNKPIRNYSILFYGSIFCLVLVALISVTQEFGLFYIKFADVTDLNKLLSNILHKLPIVLPVLWLTLFASKRRSETLRLQQEYAHKEALAKSYQSFKIQIESLNQEDPRLMVKLLESAIDAVSKNASDTLDKKHGDKTPVNEGVDGLINSIEKIRKAIA